MNLRFGKRVLAVALAAIATTSCAAQQAAAPAPRRTAAVLPAPAPRAPSPVVEPSPAAYKPYVPWDDGIGARMNEIGPRARQRWKRWFSAAGVGYPAASVVLVGFKREKQLEVYAGPTRRNLKFVRKISFTAASGGPGPKLREGDLQVPEGIYAVDKLNPNSAYHVSLHLAYPNAFDEQMAARDGRRRLGGQIMIHGSAKSIGCIAVGDEAAEDLFVLVADAGKGATDVVIVPRDFRRTGERETLPGQPAWLPELYARLDRELRTLPSSAPLATTTTQRAAATRAVTPATTSTTPRARIIVRRTTMVLPDGRRVTRVQRIRVADGAP